jgi:hypothetical protein
MEHNEDYPYLEPFSGSGRFVPWSHKAGPLPGCPFTVSVAGWALRRIVAASREGPPGYDFVAADYSARGRPSGADSLHFRQERCEMPLVLCKNAHVMPFIRYLHPVFNPSGFCHDPGMTVFRRRNSYMETCPSGVGMAEPFSDWIGLLTSDKLRISISKSLKL